MKRLVIVTCAFLFMWTVVPMAGYGAYHHMGEIDSGNFTAVYPQKANTKLDSCALCHKGGTYTDPSTSKKSTYGSCQYCHAVYNLTGTTHGSFSDTLNGYGLAYLTAGRSSAAISSIESTDSDGDGYTNLAEIQATRYPGDAKDDPSKKPAPYRIYTRAQLETMAQHTQFMMMNATRSDDSYTEYTGVPMKDLLTDAGIDLSIATGIIAYSPDGFSYTHPLYPATGQYHVYGNMTDAYQYPPALYYYNQVADYAFYSTAGWCYWTAPGCVGRADGDPIVVGDGGLKAILAIRRDGAYLDVGHLNASNKLDGEGPFRVVVPQTVPCPPDQPSTRSNSTLIWPYDSTWDHNAGACSRTATIIKVTPLPEGTTDIDTMEAGWAYVDGDKIVVYGAINGTDSNGNGILDSEEGTDDTKDTDCDGTPDYKDPDSANFNNPNGSGRIFLHTSAGALVSIYTMGSGDTSIPTKNSPLAETDGNGKAVYTAPYGVTGFSVTGLEPGASAVVTLKFPHAVPEGVKYFKVTSADGWKEIPFTKSSDGTIVSLTLTDGDPATDADGVANGVIVDPGAVVVAADDTASGESSSDDDSSSKCFMSAAEQANASFGALLTLCITALLFCLGMARVRE